MADAKKEVVSRVVEHELVWGIILMTGVANGVEITALADIPSSGSGLGSSSAVAVRLGLSAAEHRSLQQQIMLFCTGITRSADSLLAERTANITISRPQLDTLRDVAASAVDQLRQ